MLPADWEEYLVRLERNQSRRPETAPAKPRPLRRMTSPRQRQAESLTKDPIRAMYQKPTPTNGAQLGPQGANGRSNFTTNLGGACENPNAQHGKATQARRPGKDN